MHQLVTSVPALFDKFIGSCKNTFFRRGSRERGFWPRKYDFMLSSLGYQIGLAKVWGFPFLCYANGGFAFLVSYLVMIMLLGLPIIFLEMAFGQYTNMGPVHGWKTCPIMTGVGWAMCSVSSITCIYYNMLIAWSLYYTAASVLSSKLPWSDCKNLWNDHLCIENWKQVASLPLGQQQPCSPTQIVNCTPYETSSEQYYERKVFGYVDYNGKHRKMTDPLGNLQWHSTLCLFLCWLFVFLSMVRGIRTTSKVVYFSATFPLLLLSVLLVRAVTLPGAAAGLKVLVTPDFAKLLDASVWIAATNQVMFSLGGGNGVVMTLASFNKLHHNFYRDAIVICIVDTVTSVVGSLAVFSVLGYVSHTSGLPVRTDQPGRSFAFVVFAEAATSMPSGQAWSAMFFFMLVTLGIDSQFLNLECPMTAMLDQWPSLRESAKKEILLKTVACTVLFLLGLPLCCQGGIFVFDVYNNYSTHFGVYVVALGEVVGVCCFYGLGNFLSDIEIMLGFRPGFYWIACWTVLNPLILVSIFVFGLVTYKRPAVGDGSETMTDWGEALGWIMILMPIVIIGAFTVMWRPNVTTRPASDHLENRLMRIMGLMAAAAEMQLGRQVAKKDDEDDEEPGIDVGSVPELAMTGTVSAGDSDSCS